MTTLTRPGSPTSANGQRSRRGADLVPRFHPGQGTRQRLTRQEGLVTLDVHDGIEAGELGSPGHFCHPVRSRHMGGGGEHSAHPGHFGDAGHLLRIGGHDQLSDQAMVQHALDDPGD